MEAQATDYSNWSQESLLKRVTELELKLKVQAASFEALAASNTRISPPLPKPSRTNRVFDAPKYSTRLIALKVAYLGRRYNGFEYHANNKTPLPTVEEILWKAMDRSKLLFPTTDKMSKPGEVNWEGCDYTKCGRTDKGVSAFGQVIGIRVRSNRPVSRHSSTGVSSVKEGAQLDADAQKHDPRPSDVELPSSSFHGVSLPNDSDSPSLPNEPTLESDIPFDSIQDEIPYPQVLNRNLPEDIRVLAWCPSPPHDFSARFSCKERRYRYFFTQPAYAPTPGSDGLTAFVGEGHARRREGWLDIQAMRVAAKAFEGLHDFRNFCKMDPSRQMTNFERRILFADIEEVDARHGPVGYVGKPSFGPSEALISPSPGNSPQDTTNTSTETTTPKIYSFTVHGSAFLWHQVRCMAAILFLIGQGLESPSLVSALLDTGAIPTRPMYEMAADTPLVLWDCIFPGEGSDDRADALEWIHVGDDRMTKSLQASKSAIRDGKYGTGGVVDDFWKVWRKRKIDEVLAGLLLDVAVGEGVDDLAKREHTKQRSKSQRVFDGGNEPAMRGKYVPVLEKARMESIEVLNARYAAKKGSAPIRESAARKDGQNHEMGEDEDVASVVGAVA